MVATTRLLLEAAHGTNDPAVLTEAAKGSGSVTTDQVREIAKAKLADYKTDELDRAVSVVTGAAKGMNIQVR
ncbi:hypothetical protein [Pseudonocardia sp. DLS-67]